MIIKSMSRKTPSFGQLIDYMADIDKSDEQYNIYHNIYGQKAREIRDEFLKNARLVAKRRNGNYLYHEILSIKKAQGLDEKKQKVILRSIAYRYIKERADKNLAFAVLHDDHDEHLHYHFVISANTLEESKKTRLSKLQFDRFKKQMEAWALEQYPELEQKVLINKQPKDEKQSNREYEYKKRSRKVSRRDVVKAKLQSIFKHSNSKQDFFDLLHMEGFELYVRGKTLGVKEIETEQKFRLKTLGVMDEFQAMSVRIDLDEAKKQKSKTENSSQVKKKSTQPKEKTKAKAEQKQSAESSVEQEVRRRQEQIKQRREEQKNEHKQSQNHRKDKE